MFFDITKARVLGVSLCVFVTDKTSGKLDPPFSEAQKETGGLLPRSTPVEAEEAAAVPTGV
jgi:hypothetical protein